MQKYQNNVSNGRGVPVASATVTVLKYPSGAAATIYSDDGVTQVSNTLFTDANGGFSFYAPDGRYTLQIGGTGITPQTVSDILLSDSLVVDQPAAGPISGSDIILVTQAGEQSQATIDELAAFIQAPLTGTGSPDAGTLSGTETMPVTRDGEVLHTTPAAIATLARAPIANGTAVDAGALLGSETIPVSRGVGLLQTTAEDLAEFAQAPIANSTADDAGALTGTETVPVSRGAGLMQTTTEDLAALAIKPIVEGSAPAAGTLTGTEIVTLSRAGALVQTPISAITGSGGAVTSVAGRTGDIELTIADVEGAAPKSSPQFTGIVEVPTAAPGTSNEQAASTEFVMTALATTGSDAGVRFVESFPTSGTDDTVQLHNALDWLKAAPNRTLAMQHGKLYTVSAPYTLTGASHFQIEANGATIKGANGMSCDFGNWLLSVNGCGDGLVTDLLMDGNRANRPVVEGLQEAHNIQVWDNCQRIEFVRVYSDNACCDGFYLGATDPTNAATFPTSIKTVDCRALSAFRNGLSLINTVDFEDYRGVYNDAHGTAPEDGIDCEPNGSEGDGDKGNINPRFYGTTASGNAGLGFQVYRETNYGVKMFDVTAIGNESGAVSTFLGGVEIHGITLEDSDDSDTDRGVIDLAGAGTAEVIIDGVVARNYHTNDVDGKPIIFVDTGMTRRITIGDVKTFGCDCAAVIANSPVDMVQDVETYAQTQGYAVKINAGAASSVVKGVTANAGQLGVYVNAPDVSVNDVKLDNPTAAAVQVLFDTGALRGSLDGVEVFQQSGVPAGQIGVRFVNAPARATNIIGRTASGTAWTPTTIAVFAGGTTGSLIANISPATASGAIPQPSTTTPSAPGTAAVGTATTYARADHTHAAQAVPAAASTTPLVESGSGAVGSSAAYARADHVHPAGSGGGGTTTVRAAALRNWKKSNTSNIAAIMGRGQSGFGRGRILGIGDSFTAGFASSGTSFTNGRQNAFLTHLAKAMAARGMNVSADWAVGDGNSGDVPLVYDPRLVLSGGTSLLNDFNCLGGSGWTMDGTGNQISFTPATPFDTVEVLVMMNNNTGVSGNFDVFYNGSGTAAQTVTSNDILGVKKVTLTVPGGTTATSVQFQRKTNATFIAAVGTRVAAKPGIEIINAGSTGTPLATYAAAPGSTTGSGDVNTWNTRAASAVLMDTNALNVTFINGWYNDKDASSTIAATQTQLANLITAAKAWGDVVYIGYAPLDPSDTTLTLYNQWQDAMYATCTTADIPIIDPPAQLPVYATGISYNLYGDPLHLNGSGHAIIARSILQAMDDIA